MKSANQTQAKIGMSKQGSILIYNVVIIFIFSLVMLGALSYASYQLKLTAATVVKQQAFQIAEAGMNYYEWRLAHFPADFWDGNASTTPGPYIHDYVDSDTHVKLGEYSLQITAPPVGSTIATIQSTGYTVDNPNTRRTITVRYGVPSVAKYAFLTNGDVWIGSTENVSGELHANGGIRFDGTGNAPITSSKSTYLCQTYHGCGPTTKPGVWGSAPLSTQAFWQYPVPNVDFSTMTSDLANIKATAQSGGIYLPPSNKRGYSLVFTSDGHVRIYKVNSVLSNPTGFDVNGNAHNEGTDYNSRSEQTTICSPSPCAIPSNGVIYVEDKTWVEGTVNGRVLVAAAKLPYNANTAPSILIPNNIVYAAKDGTDSLGLISQQDVLLTYRSPNNLEIDAAMIAQNGSAQHFEWDGDIKNKITIYGAVASFGTWTWSWVDGWGNTISGYQYTQTTYDSNLLYAPPPSFPLTSDGYVPISWTSN